MVVYCQNGSYGFYGHFGVQRVFGQIWVQGVGGQNWLRWVQFWFGTHLALGARWLPPLDPFSLIGLGQKGPNTPTDRGLWPTGRRSRRGPKWPNKAIYARTPLMKGVGSGWMEMARGPGGSKKTKGPPRPKNRDEGLGVGEVEIGQGGQ
ncbi:hypothetical protein O181_003725 [Austropuccinia psidii MF-1]|uniref:Uncharacterized protein n=1 Tax=Austropuccinia psidii MF-1 TaxID=1389203 RepID=A0A9Q3BFK0_9BASI|nr:hypothetical protein [Austropuccinia psidii MF-1]